MYIDDSNHKAKIGVVSIDTINKAYSNGILLPHTKTYEIRLFPINLQLKVLLDSMDIKPNRNDLIFPSVTGGYVNHMSFY